jgi:hypothetical protein
MADARLFLVSGKKSRPHDYDVREGTPGGRLVGRIYKYSHAPTGKWWFWAVQIFPAVASDSGAEDTRDAAMAALKAQWLLRREAWEAWVGPAL